MSQLNKGRLPGGTAKITMPQSQGARDIEAQFPGATVEFSDVATLFPVNLEHRTRRSVGRHTGVGNRPVGRTPYSDRSRRFDF